MTSSTGDIYRVALTGSSPQASVFQNVWHYTHLSGVGIAENLILPAVATNYGTAWLNMQGLTNNAYSWNTLELWKYNPTTHKWEGKDTEVLSSLTGGAAADPVAHGVAAVGRFVTEVARRQGRHFYPGLIETAVDLGLLDAATITAFTAYMVQFCTDIVAAGATFRIGTYNLDPTSVYYESFSAYDAVILISNIVGYQRRRKPLVGI